MLKQSFLPSSKEAGSTTRRKSRSAQILKQSKEFCMPVHDENRVIETFFASLDTSFSLMCAILYRTGEHEQLVRLEIDPLHYVDAFRFRDDFAALCFLRKSITLKTGIDKREVALSAFSDAEASCKVTNARFRDLAFDPQFQGSNCWLLNAVIRKVARILGDVNVSELFDLGSWGPGSTQCIKGKNVSASRKFRDENGITSNAYALFVDAARLAYPRWFDEEMVSRLQISEANSIITVPKNAKTDRTIAVEPGINSWFQLAVGRSIRRRLRRAGFDLNSDKANCNGAYYGSKFGQLATVDFSAASDTIARRVVEEILPPPWFTVLDALRSHNYSFDRKTHTPYQKFSAMGCGFTFELESLIFVSMALCVCEYLDLSTEHVCVFGDDIIIPVEAFALYSQFSAFLGFKVNPEKSFSSGPFRESCGAYYFNGVDVKPFFKKEALNGTLTVYRFANNIRLLAHRRNLSRGCDVKLKPVWNLVISLLPSGLAKISGPQGAGDGCIHRNFDESSPRIARDGWCGYLHPAILTDAVVICDESVGHLNARLWKRSELIGFGNQVSLKAVIKTRFKNSCFAPQWYDFGPWY